MSLGSHDGHITQKCGLIIYQGILSWGAYRAVLKLLDGFLAFHIAHLMLRSATIIEPVQ